MWLLRSIDSPYAVGGVPGPIDFCYALMVCSSTRKEFGQVLAEGPAAVVEKLVGKYFMMSAEQADAEKLVFEEYLERQTLSPEFWSDADSDAVKDRLRCPAEWHLVLSLLRYDVCKTEGDAWDYPYNRAVCWRAVIGEQVDGSRSYVDPLDRSQMEILNHVSN